MDPAKDADGLHPVNLGRLVLNVPGPLPCTPVGIVELLRRYDVPIAGAEVVVVGRGITVGRPLGLLLTRRSRERHGDALPHRHAGPRRARARRRHRGRGGRGPGPDHRRRWSSRAPRSSTSGSAGSTARSPATSPLDVRGRRRLRRAQPRRRRADDPGDAAGQRRRRRPSRPPRSRRCPPDGRDPSADAARRSTSAGPFLAGLVRQLPLLAVLVAVGVGLLAGGRRPLAQRAGRRRRWRWSAAAVLRLLAAGAPGRASSPSAAGRSTSSSWPGPGSLLTVDRAGDRRLTPGCRPPDPGGRAAAAIGWRPWQSSPGTARSPSSAPVSTAPPPRCGSPSTTSSRPSCSPTSSRASPRASRWT